MSVHFSSIGSISGYDIHHGDYTNMYVEVHHSLREGYPMSRSGQEIRERMTLSEFLGRLGIEGKRFEEHVRCIMANVASHDKTRGSRLDNMADEYNDRYLQGLRSGQIMHPDLKASLRQKHVFEYEYEKRKMEMNANYGELYRPLKTEDSGKESIDNEIYYLLTP